MDDKADDNEDGRDDHELVDNQNYVKFHEDENDWEFHIDDDLGEFHDKKDGREVDT